MQLVRGSTDTDSGWVTVLPFTCPSLAVMSSSKDVAARARLTEKLHRVNDAQSRLRSHVVAIEQAAKDLSSCSLPVLIKTEAVFNELQEAVNRRRVAVLERTREQLGHVVKALDLRKQQCETLAAEAEKVRG